MNTEQFGKGFAVIPHSAILDNNLTDLQFRLFCLLAAMDFDERDTGRKGYCFPSQDTLAALLNCTPRGIRKALAALEQRGYILVDRRAGGPKGGSSNRYYLLVRSESDRNVGSSRCSEESESVHQVNANERQERRFRSDRNVGSSRMRNGGSYEEIKEKKTNPEETKASTDCASRDGASRNPCCASAQAEAHTFETADEVIRELFKRLGGRARATRILGGCEVWQNVRGGYDLLIPEDLIEAWDDDTYDEVVAAAESLGIDHRTVVWN